MPPNYWIRPSTIRWKQTTQRIAELVTLMLKDIVIFLRSPRLAIAILLLLLACCVAATVLPQSSTLSPQQISEWQQHHPRLAQILLTFRLFDIFTSPLFFGLLALFFANLLLCTIETCRSNWQFAHCPWHADGRKVWGGFTTHLGLLLLAVSVFLDYGWGARGEFFVKENMIFPKPGLLARFCYGFLHTATKPGSPDLGFTIEFHKLELDYQLGQNTRNEFKVSVRDRSGTVTPGVIAPNRPLHIAGYAITSNKFGFAPEVIVRQGQQQLVALPATLYSFLDRRDKYLDNLFYLPNRLLLKVEFAPDADTVDTANFRVTNRSYYLRHPVFIFTLTQHEQELGKAVQELGKAVLMYPLDAKTPVFANIGEYQIGVGRIEYWASFFITRNPALFGVYLGMWLCIAGLVLTYLPLMMEPLQ
jgi:hypothetical protein